MRFPPLRYRNMS